MMRSPRLYKFGPFQLDPTERRLFRDERPIELAPKVFDLLFALVKKNGRLVSKDALMKFVWPNCFVADNNLTVQMSRLRRVLGEGKDSEGYIETVPGLGYRFVAKVSRATDDEVHAVVPEALRAYQKGRYFWNKRSPADLELAVRHFKQAIDIDPGYAVAYAGHADCLNLLTSYGFISPRESIPEIKSLVNKARRLDHSLAEAWTTLGYINLFHDWNWASAERNLRKALKIDPHYAVARSWYAMNLMITDRYEEARDELLLALTIDPLSPIINIALGGYYFYAREYDKAVVQCREAIAIDANFHLGYATLGAVYAQLGKYNEATQLLEKALGLSRYVESVAELAYVYARTDRTDEAWELIQELIKDSNRYFISPFGIAIAYVGLGETDEAFRWLDRACNDRNRWMVWIRDDPRLEELQRDRRFRALLDRVGLSPRKQKGGPPALPMPNRPSAFVS